MNKSIIIFVYFFLISTYIFPQARNKYKYELLGGIGPTGFLGDLGGADRDGSHFLRDYNFNHTRFNINGGIRYKQAGSRFAFKGMLTYAMVSGNDALTQDP